VGPVTFARLLEQFPDLRQLFINATQIQNISDRTRTALINPDWEQVENDLVWFSSPNRHIIIQKDNKYPGLLKEISDPPSILYAQGDITLLTKWKVAIVGSRNPSRSGRETAFEFGRFLVQGDVVICSGMAMGIDAAAHQGALAGEGKTIAVIGTGLDRIYPAKHSNLAHEIVENGLMISEFPLGTPPRPENFPRRNRIISGLSLGTLVVEAATKSGSLITARQALEQGREVFAIPGSIHNPLARGCHQLIREGAKLVETASDIIEELGALAAVDLPAAASFNADQNDLELDEEYRVLLNCLAYDPIEVDSLIQESGLTADSVSSMLLLLELQGHVESLPGGRYVRVSS
jgi:DNA processing protein